MDQQTSLTLFDTFQNYLALIERESDRGAVIVGVSILDGLVRDGIAARLVPAMESDDELLEGGSSPVSTFSARIDVAYRIGIITTTMRSSLHLLRKMRNDAAHVGEHRDFASPELRSRLRELFRLNQALIAVTWTTVGVFEPGAPAKPPASNDEVSAFVNRVGWRTAWNHFIALLAAALTRVPDTITQLEPLSQDASKGPSGV